MRRYMAAVWAIAWKDLLLEYRGKETVASVLAFALLIVVMLDFAIQATPGRAAFVAPGVLWVAFAFAGAVGLTRTFSAERERGNIHGLMLAPIGRDVIFFGKALSSFVFLLAVEAVVFPVFGILFNYPLASPELVPVFVLATLGFSLSTTRIVSDSAVGSAAEVLPFIGTVFSAMAVNTRAREVMLPLLFFPVALPVILAGLEATTRIVSDSAVGSAAEVLPFIAAYDLVFAVVGPAAFHLIVRD